VIGTPFRKKATRAIVPSASRASAAMAMAAGAVAFAPLGGLVRVMVGAAFTFTVAALELVLAPRLSTTTAVSAYAAGAGKTAWAF
jgi:hypothetical protein